MKKNNFISKIIYNLFSGFHSAEKEIMSNSSENDSNLIINQNIDDEKLSKALIKGEVNNEVEDLRYRTYKIYDSSKEYEYLGNGKVVKKDRDSNKIDFENSDNLELILIQENKVQPITFEEEVEEMNGKYIKREYTLNIEREFVPRYKIEEFARKIVLKKIDEKHFQLDLYFDNTPNEEEYKSKGFINELNKIKNEGIRSDILDVKRVSFVTSYAYNYDDFYKFSFDNVFFNKIILYNNSLIIRFKCHLIDKPIHLIDKYYSNRMEQKYKEKEKKDVIFNLSEIDKKEYVCSECGKVINNDEFLKNGNNLEFYDAQITLETYGRVICKDCLKKIIDKHE